MQYFEYRTQTIQESPRTATIGHQLSEYGAQGWRFAGVLHSNYIQPSATTMYYVLLERPVELHLD